MFTQHLRVTRSLALCLCCLILSFTVLQAEHPAIPTSVAEQTIRWVDFTPSAAAISDAIALDAAAHKEGYALSAVTLLAVYATRTGGSFVTYKRDTLAKIADSLRAGDTPLALAKNERLLSYYLAAYGAVLNGLIGGYTLDGEARYGLRGVSPIAAGYGYSHYDDFGAARSYGYKRPHLGHDMMVTVGTPIVAVESGYVETVGWNQYGGWRIGIRSFDNTRYWYYAHLRRGHPYNDMYEGKSVEAGEVIGYAGMTGYSTKENTNNIDTPHLHIGLQLIFDPAQKEGNNQIWVDLYPLMQVLAKSRSEVYYDASVKEHYAVHTRIADSSPD